MAAAFHGFNGSVTFPTVVLTSLISWSLETVAGMTEVTDMSDSTNAAKIYLHGYKSWTATVEALIPTTGIVTSLETQLGSTGELILLGVTGSSPNYTGTGICTGIGVSGNTEGPVTATFTFQGSGSTGMTEV